MIAQPKPKTLRSPRFLAFLRTLECGWCGHQAPSEAAHMGGGRGIATKGPDDRAIPLCAFRFRGGKPIEGCHHHLHRTGRLPGDRGLTMDGAAIRSWAEVESADYVARFLASGGVL